MIQEIELAQIRTNGGTQIRLELDNDLIDNYRELIENGATLPPIDVFNDGSSYWLADGFHRFYARKRAGFKTITCNVHDGEKRDAILFACGANQSHGLRRSNADKRHAVEVLLADPEWAKKSDRWIADKAGCSDRFVSGVRSTTNGSESTERIGKDGRTINTGNIGSRTSDWEPPEDDPRYCPQEGAGLLIRRRNARPDDPEYIIVASSTHAGYFYVTRLVCDVDGDGAWFEGGNRPMLAPFAAQVARKWASEYGEDCVCWRVPGDDNYFGPFPWTFNIRLYDTREDYVQHVYPKQRKESRQES